MPVPAYKKFKLTEPIDFVPAGATGRIIRVDKEHVALLFDAHPDLVFDVHDTEPAVWAAIRPQHTIGWRRLAIAASLVSAFVAGGAILPAHVSAAAFQAAVSLIYEDAP
jgi:hypothetical protein